MRQPGIEPGPPRWQRGILTTELLAPCIYIQEKKKQNKRKAKKEKELRALGIEPRTFCV